MPSQSLHLAALAALTAACGPNPKPAAGPPVEPLSRALVQVERRDVSSCVVSCAAQKPLVALDSPLPPGIGLSKEQIRASIQRNIGDMRDCLLAQEADLVPPLGAPPLRYPVKFSIASDGQLTCVEPENREPELAAFTCCFIPRMARWQFPSHGADDMRVSYPFLIGTEAAPEATPIAPTSTRR